MTVTAPLRPAPPARSARIETGHPDVEIIDVTKVSATSRPSTGCPFGSPGGAFYSLLGRPAAAIRRLRMIAGFEQHDRRRVSARRPADCGVPPYRRNVNTVFQHYALFPHIDVAQNVGYGLRQKKVGRAEEQRRASEVLALVRLGG